MSSQKNDTVFRTLSSTALPEKEMVDLLNRHDSLSLANVMECFDAVIAKLTRWLEAAQMAVFTFEINVKEESPDLKDMESLLELAIGRMEPLIAILEEVGAIVDDKFEQEEETPSQQQRKMMARMSITKIQSEWSSLHHFLDSVKKQLDSVAGKRELTALMERVLEQIDDISIMIFQFQENRFAAAPRPSATTTGTDTDILNSPLSTASSGLFSSSTTVTSATTAASFSLTDLPHKYEEILADIDNRVDPLFNDVQKIYASMTSNSPPSDPTGVLARKHQIVQERWEALRVEIDDLKEDIKEDRWLSVFRQVTDHVETLIECLDKTISQCYSVVQQVYRWHSSNSSDNGASISSHLNPLDKVSRTVMQMLPKSHSPQQQHATSPLPPVDREKLKSIERTLEARYKHFVPSINKTLRMAGEQILPRITRDKEATQRYQSLIQRLAQVETSMETLRSRDLPDIEHLIMSAHGASQDRHSTWRNIRYKTPEPSSPTHRSYNTLPKSRYGQEDHRFVRSVTPSCISNHNYNLAAMRQPRAASSMSFARDNMNIRPSASESSSMSSGSQLFRHGAANRQTKSPVVSGSEMPRRKSRVPGGSGGEDERGEASWMKPTKSTLMRDRRTQSVDHSADGNRDLRPKTPIQRSKTPNPGDYSRRKSLTPSVAVPSRPKSSLGHERESSRNSHLLLPYPDQRDHNHERAVSPLRRTMTPSYIPRPKTPQGHVARAASPSLIPRPRSSMHFRGSSPPPPVPQLPPTLLDRNLSQVVSSNNSSDNSHPSTSSFLSIPDSSPPAASVRNHKLQHRESPSRQRLLNKKQSMPALAHHRAASPFLPPPSTTRTPSPQLYRRRTAAAGYLYEDDEDFYLARRRPSDRYSATPITYNGHEVYVPDSKDPLDIEVAKIVNASPIPVKCQRGPQGGGKYFFGNELSPSVVCGKKMYTCKLMTYDRDVSSRRNASSSSRNKVLVRVGGGWQDLEMFLLDHSNLMAKK